MRDREHQRTIEEIRLEDVRPVGGAVEPSETRSDYARTRPPEKKQIEYREYDNVLLSEESEEHNVFVRSNEPTPKRKDKYKQQQQQQAVAQPAANSPTRQREEERARNIEIMDMGNMELETGSQPDHEYEPSNPSSHHESNHLEDRQHPPISMRPGEDYLEQQREVFYEEEAKSQGNRESEATRRNYYSPARKNEPANRRNVVVDVTEVDQSLRGEEDYAELEEASQSDREPAGISRPHQAKPDFRERAQRSHSRSDFSGTIEEIPQHQLPFDDQKTVSNADAPQRPPRPQVSQQQITSIFAGSLPANQKAHKHHLPAEEADQFRINRLYSNENPLGSNNPPRTARNEEVLPRNNLQRERKSTLAQAGRAQLGEDGLAQKRSTGRSPLKVARQWEAQHEDKSFSEEEEFAPISNRNNLVRRQPPAQNFASHLVLPQETDRQDTSFQHPRREAGGKQDSSFQQQRREVPLSGKAPSRQLEEIEVHFEAEQPSRELSLSGKNRSPSRPAAYGRQPSREESSGVEEEDVDYRQMMVLGQMQERPRNSDLQDYYRKPSKEKRRKSNSRLDRSTEKIYMQKLDKKR